MKKYIVRAVLLLLCCGSLHIAIAQEFRSGLLLVAKHNHKRTKVIPINKKVKIWAGEDNKLYCVKILAVDSVYAYLSQGVRIPIKSINQIKRKRIMFRDVGNATVVTGVLGSVATDDRNDSQEASLGDDLKCLGVGVVVSAVAAVGVGVATLTAGVLIAPFEPPYKAEKWNIEPLNPEKEVFFQNYLQNERRRK